MKFLLAICILLCAVQKSFSQPKLVVGIVVDQMRYDYLTKYNEQYTEGGFTRFYSKGFVYANHNYNYSPTLTGPGHASVYTGTTPAINGIIGNEWYNKINKKDVYCAEDFSVQPVGTDNSESKRSPVLMNTTTIGDQLRFHTSMQSKVVGVALKDRGAILPAGHRANGAFWFDGKSGNFVTSTYYMPQLPEWVQQFNEKKLPGQYLNQQWNLLLPADKYPETDDVLYEIPYRSLSKAVFPYDLKKLAENTSSGIVVSTPFGNTLTVDFAIATIEGENLGSNKVTDMLAVSFSTPDYMGHQFGPHSREIHDMYLRLDLELKRFFDYLDKKFGMDNVLVFLTADHGAADVPAFVKSNTGYYSENKIQNYLNDVLQKKFRKGPLIENVSNLQIFLNHSVMEKFKIDEEDILQTCKQNIDSLSGIYGIMLASDLGECSWVSKECELLKNGYNPKRSGDLILMAQPGWIGDYSLRGGTTHGSPFVYDTHVPMLWMGWKIPHGISYQRTEIPDIAPTLAMMLGCSAPNGTTGTPMALMFEEPKTK